MYFCLLDEYFISLPIPDTCLLQCIEYFVY